MHNASGEAPLTHGESRASCGHIRALTNEHVLTSTIDVIDERRRKSQGNVCSD